MRVHRLHTHFQVVANAHAAPLAADLDDEVENLWLAEMKSREGLFNGQLLSVDSFEPERIAGTFVEYRRLVAQRLQPRLFASLRIRPLAVSGIVVAPDGLLFGRRSLSMASSGGLWELAPSGGLDPETSLRNGIVDYMAQFYAESAEEVGIERSRFRVARPILIIEGDEPSTFDIVIHAHVDLSIAEVADRFGQVRGEYSDFKIVPESAMREFIDESRPQIDPTTLAALEACDYI